MRDATRPHLDPGHVGHSKMGNDDEPDVGLMILYILYILHILLYSDNIKQAHIISYYGVVSKTWGFTFRFPSEKGVVKKYRSSIWPSPLLGFTTVRPPQVSWWESYSCPTQPSPRHSTDAGVAKHGVVSSFELLDCSTLGHI